MIEITGARTRKDEKEKITKKSKLAHVKHGGKTFSSELHKTMALEFEGPIDELMENLKDQEKRFLDKQTELRDEPLQGARAENPQDDIRRRIQGKDFHAQEK